MRITRTKRAHATAAITVAAALTLGGVIASPAGAADNPQLTLSISGDATTADIVAGVPVTVTYTVSNDTGEALTVPESAGIEAYLKIDYFAARPTAEHCDWPLWGFQDSDAFTALSWAYELPTVVPPGPVTSCTLTYTPSADDVAAGGLWGLVGYEPDVTTGAWDFSMWFTAAPAGAPDRPVIAGTPALGRPVGITPGLWPFYSADWTAFTYQWLRDGTEIGGATSETYTPVVADVGSALSVRMFDESTGITRTTAPVTVARFTDVPSSYAFASYISWLAGKGISTGYAQPDGSFQFKPTTAVSREAMAAFLYRDIAPGGYTPPASARFSDVPTSYPFYANVAWLAQQGISTGYADGTFKPTDAVTREAMAAFLYRAAGSPAYTPPATPRFSDVPTSYPFYKQVSWLAAQGISTGYADGTFKPTAPVTREAMAAFLQRADPIFHPAG